MFSCRLFVRATTANRGFRIQSMQLWHQDRQRMSLKVSTIKVPWAPTSVYYN